MEIAGNNPISPRTAGRAAQPAGRSSEGFMRLLKGGRPGGGDEDGQQQKLRQATEQLVSSALLKPLFKQMRSSPFRVERFHGGQGEKAFMQQFHTLLADRITRSTNFNLVDAIHDKMAKQYQRTKEAAGPSSGQEVNVHG
jgi:hypothetical protein